MNNNNDALNYIMSMKKTDFHHKIIRGVANTTEFSALVSFGADVISDKDKEKLCQAIIDAGVPIQYEKSSSFDERLEEIVHPITARAVSVS